MKNINLIGSPIQTKLIESILENVSYFNLTDYKNADIIYYIYGPGFNKKNFFKWIFSNKIYIIHWIGLDTEIYLGNNKNLKVYISHQIKKIIIKLRFLFRKRKTHFISSSPWLTTAVQDKSKIPTQYLVITSIFEEKMKMYLLDHERNIDFLTYTPLSAKNIYSVKEIIESAKKFPKSNFVFIVPDLKNNESYPYKIPQNIKILPKQSQHQMWELYNQTKCFIRLKKTGDAISLSVLEALFFKCHVIWNYEFKGTIFTQISQLDISITKVLSLNKLNEEGHEIIKNQYTVKAWINQFKNYIESISLKKS